MSSGDVVCDSVSCELKKHWQSILWITCVAVIGIGFVKVSWQSCVQHRRNRRAFLQRFYPRDKANTKSMHMALPTGGTTLVQVDALDAEHEAFCVLFSLSPTTASGGGAGSK